MRTILLTTSALFIAGSIAVSGAGAQAKNSTGGTHTSTTGVTTSDQALIANALSAAPAAIAKGATVMAHDGRVLRRGTTDWVCMPDMSDAPNDTPMCLDAEWRAFIDAWMNKRTPSVTRMAFGYMLQGDLPVSNVDPFAKEPTATNQWLQTGEPHVMVLVPDAKLLETISADPANGGPFVMWKGTPYVHLMIPTTAAPKAHP